MEVTRGARGARVRRSGKPRGRVNVGLTRTAEAAEAGAIGHGSLLWLGGLRLLKVTLRLGTGRSWVAFSGAGIDFGRHR